MDKDFYGFLALFFFALPFIAFVVIVAVKIIKRLQASGKRTEVQHNSSKNPQEKFTDRNLGGWITVGEYDIYVHRVTEHMHTRGSKTERVLQIEVEYQNRSGRENLSCRRNQWRLYADDGYSFEALSDLGAHHLYQERAYFGGERFINPGMNARGWLAFQVPEDARIILLQFMTAFLRTKTVDILIENAVEKEAAVGEAGSRISQLQVQVATLEKAAADFLGALSNTDIQRDLMLAAEMAGLKLLRSTGVDLTRHTPGHMLLGAVPDQAYQDMQRFTFTWARRKGLPPVNYSDIQLSQAAKEYLPQVAGLEPAFDSICQEYKIQPEEARYAAVWAALQLAAEGEKTGLLDARTGQTMVLYHIMLGSKMVPEVLAASAAQGGGLVQG